ncbi:MAG: ergothioneine biosynthesis protein EgtB [Pseudomonadales bacterium]|nr:ergothioneine biosynthesis protein EgtB [Pseudomonadales bacterium]MBO6596577.1 ergothioneine biosynthesis protein EgtB [Pseudomonadales bacterium]MBO6703272.1 ergothioneine biosynthesis protein EgtB [Pseudomonadales bacterium]MBO6823434.1 ergothioneine biosynthesis protein EgtB [Pseudomonadales bacterium]MBO7006082.1 ergothioneine biosynthesis protein EgtB [Pseudomonadales bacterium]
MSAILHTDSSESLVDRYQQVRQQTIALCAPLETEDYQVQPMDDASPPKWHLAHVTWFFETFLLVPELPGYQRYNEAFETLFNSYYNGVGKPFPRPRRGHLSRPTVAEIFEYRAQVDDAMVRYLSGSPSEEGLFKVEVGLNHEQQHQELLLTDLKYNLGNNPLKPAYVSQKLDTRVLSAPGWRGFEGGLVEVGSDAAEGYVFDNETPRHQVFLAPFELASRPISNGEFIEFIQDGGYERFEFWLSDGWTHLASLGDDRWRMPLYWRQSGDEYFEYTLGGERRVDLNAPVCHISGYEADAFARWRGCRLPTEHEWELAAQDRPVEGNFLESGSLHPVAVSEGESVSGLFGDTWEWTSSSYGPYPGYQSFKGQLGEYNGKFMANQLVLRGGSCVSAVSHVRATYRNFFYLPDRWQFTGLRLARDIT